MSTSPDPCSDLSELVDRLEMGLAAITDARDQLNRIIGEGYSATIPMFQLGTEITSMRLMCLGAIEVAKKLKANSERG